MAHIILIGTEIEENLSLRYLSSYLKQNGNSTEIIPFNHWIQKEDVLNKIISSNPDLVAMSVAFQYRAGEFLSLADELKNSGFNGHITAGGHFATFAYKEILNSNNSIDSIIRFNGEKPLLELVNSIVNNEKFDNIPSLVYRDKTESTIKVNDSYFSTEFHENILPDRCGHRNSSLYLNNAPVISSQGCWGGCSFCCIHAWRKEQKSNRIEHRDLKHLAWEMFYLFNEHNVKVFIFHDDNFFLPKESDNIERVNQLKTELINCGINTDTISINVKGRPETITDNVIEALKGIGLTRIYLGVENLSSNGLKQLYRGLSVEKNLQSLKILENQNIFTCYNILLITPWTTLQDLKENIDNLRKSPNHFPFNVCRTEVYYGSKVYNLLKEEGRLKENINQFDYEVLDPQVEVFFRIFEAGFSHRSFDINGSIHIAMNLGNNISMAKRHYSEINGLNELESDILYNIEQVNKNTIDFLNQIYDFVNNAPYTKDYVEKFALEFAFKVAQKESLELKELLNLDKKLKKIINNYIGKIQKKKHESIVKEMRNYVALPVATVAFGALLSQSGITGCDYVKGMLNQSISAQNQVQIQNQIQNQNQVQNQVFNNVGQNQKQIYPMKSTFFPLTSFPEHQKICSAGYLIMETLLGAIPANYGIRFSTTNQVNATSFISPDRTKIITKVESKTQNINPQQVMVSMEIFDGNNIVQKTSEYFWMYSNGSFSFGSNPLPSEQNPAIMDPVPMPSAVDLTPEKEVDILFRPRYRQYPSPDNDFVFLFNTRDGMNFLFNGIDLSVGANLKQGETIQLLEITTTGGKLKTATSTIEEDRIVVNNTQYLTYFQYFVPKTGNQIQAGSYFIDAQYTILKNGRQIKINGRANIVVENNGNILIKNVINNSLNKRQFPLNKVKSLPRNLKISLGIISESDSNVILETRIYKTKESDEVFLNWEVTAGKIKVIDNRVEWNLTDSSGINRLTVWAKDKDGAIGISHYYRGVGY